MSTYQSQFAPRRLPLGGPPKLDPRMTFVKVSLTVAERARVEARALDRGVSIASIVRDALDLYFGGTAK